jgi:hypothetical protein
MEGSRSQSAAFRAGWRGAEMKSGFRTALVLIVLSSGLSVSASAQDAERGRVLFDL